MELLYNLIFFFLFLLSNLIFFYFYFCFIIGYDLITFIMEVFEDNPTTIDLIIEETYEPTTLNVVIQEIYDSIAMDIIIQEEINKQKTINIKIDNPITIDIIIQEIDKIILIMILIYLLFCFIIQIMMYIIIQIIVNLPIIIINFPKIIINLPTIIYNLPTIIHNLPIIIHNFHITIIESFEVMIELFILRIDMIASGNMFFVIMSIAIITHLFNICIKLIIEKLSIEEFDLSYKINIIFLIIIATIILNNDFCYTEEPFLHLMNNEKKGLNFEGFKEYFFCAINYRIACDFMWFILSKILDKFNNGIKFFKKIWSI